MKALKRFFFLLTSLYGCNLEGHTTLQIELELVATGFTSPVALAYPNDGSNRLFVAGQTGLIWIFREGQQHTKSSQDPRRTGWYPVLFVLAE
ncbi:MAG TPA: hypothetical protein VFG81_11865 [Anaerolineales bacterium]|jgi:hypothetical protein|nr:hypothetical protein [Anaerolineales bacterium]